MRDIDMSTKYDPTSVEAGRYDNWQSKSYLHPNQTKKFKAMSQNLILLSFHLLTLPENFI